MHKLRHEAKSVKVRTSLENFVCKFVVNPSLSSHFAYLETNAIGSNNFLESDDKSQIKDYADEPEEFFHEEIDDTYVDEPKSVRGENERTLLQIPVELLPCPQDVKSVTDRTYTYPSQNEAKDYRNLIHASAASTLILNFVSLALPLLILFGYGN